MLELCEKNFKAVSKMLQQTQIILKKEKFEILAKSSSNKREPDGNYKWEIQKNNLAR